MTSSTVTGTEQVGDSLFWKIPQSWVSLTATHQDFDSVWIWFHEEIWTARCWLSRTDWETFRKFVSWVLSEPLWKMKVYTSSKVNYVKNKCNKYAKHLFLIILLLQYLSMLMRSFTSFCYICMVEMPSDGAYFSNSVFHDLTLVAWNGQPWELWQHGDQKTLKIGALSFRESIVKHS